MVSILSSSGMVLRDISSPSASGLNKIIDNAKNSLGAWGQSIMMVIGVAMIIVGIFKIAQGLMSHGKSQVSWPVNILLIVVGSLFCAGTVIFQSLANNKTGTLGSEFSNELSNVVKTTK